MLGQKNKTHIVVVKDTAPLIETATRADLTAGQIAVFKNGSATAIDGTTDLTSGDQFKVVFKDVEGNIIESPTYKYDNIISKTAANYAAATEQKTYIGYNGTAGSIEVINNNLYYVRMYIKPMDKFGFVQQKVQFGVYQSDANATQAEIAHGISENLAFNLSREPEKLRTGKDVVTVELVNSGTSTATSGGVVGVVGAVGVSPNSCSLDGPNTSVVVGVVYLIPAASNCFFIIACLDGSFSSANIFE